MQARCMQRLGTDETRRARTVVLADRIALLEAALERATSENARMRRRDADMRAENGRLRSELDEHIAAAAAQPRRDAIREMTAGTSAGPHRQQASAHSHRHR